MRRLFVVSFFFLFTGCPAPWGYHVNLTVTVPPEVQAKVSPSNPGLVMAGLRAIGVVCQPSDVPFSVPLTDWIAGNTCEQSPGAGYKDTFVVRLSDSDIAWFAANLPTPLCGQSGPITDQKTIDVARRRAISGGWGPEGDETIADGVGAGCDDAGDYSGTIVVELRNP